MTIQQALTQLDPTNDDHWTADGLPRMDVVEGIVGDTKIKRKDVTDAAPKFTRESAQAALEPAASAEEATAADEPEEATDAEHDPFAILNMGPADFCQNEATMLSFRADAEIVMNVFIAEKKAFEEKIKAVGRACQMVDRLLTRINNAKPQADTAEVRAYLEMQAKTRAAIAERTRAFMEEGIDPARLARALQGKSQLDLALSQRKPKPGSTRPAPRLPVRK